jgi:hypothetical protein
LRLVASGAFSVALAFVAGLGGGDYLHRRFPAIPDVWLGAIVAIVIAVLGILCMRLLTGPAAWDFLPRRRTKPAPAPSQVEWMEAWDTASQAYKADPSATRTCGTLAPVERAMRTAGIPIDISGAGPDAHDILARCRINEPELMHRFALPDSVRYVVHMEPDRFDYEVPYTWIECAECGSKISTLPPDYATPQTPWFPAPPETT